MMKIERSRLDTPVTLRPSVTSPPHALYVSVSAIGAPHVAAGSKRMGARDAHAEFGHPAGLCLFERMRARRWFPPNDGRKKPLSLRPACAGYLLVIQEADELLGPSF